MRYVVFVLAVLAFCGPAHAAEQINCNVIAIQDGDTFTCLTADKQQVKVRLADIDAPEVGKGKKNPGQPYADDARDALADMVWQKDVRVNVKSISYDRKVALVYVGEFGNLDVGSAMVIKGAAWVYRAYLKGKKNAARLAYLVSFEQDAKNASRGLWALQVDQIIPPWDWRHGKAQKCDCQC